MFRNPFILKNSDWLLIFFSSTLKKRLKRTNSDIIIISMLELRKILEALGQDIFPPGRVLIIKDHLWLIYEIRILFLTSHQLQFNHFYWRTFGLVLKPILPRFVAISQSVFLLYLNVYNYTIIVNYCLNSEMIVSKLFTIFSQNFSPYSVFKQVVSWTLT